MTSLRPIRSWSGWTGGPASRHAMVPTRPNGSANVVVERRSDRLSTTKFERLPVAMSTHPIRFHDEAAGPPPDRRAQR